MDQCACGIFTIDLSEFLIARGQNVAIRFLFVRSLACAICGIANGNKHNTTQNKMAMHDDDDDDVTTEDFSELVR